MRKIILIIAILCNASIMYAGYNHNWRPPHRRPRRPNYDMLRDLHKRLYENTQKKQPTKEKENKKVNSISPPQLLRLWHCKFFENNHILIKGYDKYDVYSGEHCEYGVIFGIKFKRGKE